MNVKKFLVRQSVVIVISIVCIVAVITLSSYAAFVVQKQDQDALVIESGYLKVTFVGGNVLNILDMIPTADDNIDNLAGYTFSVKNDNSGVDASTLPAKYTIKILAGENNQVPLEYIRYKVFIGSETDPFVASVSSPQSLSESSEVIINNLSVGQTNYHGLKVWLADNAPNSVIGNNINLKIQVDSTVEE